VSVWGAGKYCIACDGSGIRGGSRGAGHIQVSAPGGKNKQTDKR
jgi:hypothetical protein